MYPRELWHWDKGSESVFAIKHRTNIWDYYDDNGDEAKVSLVGKATIRHVEKCFQP